MIHLLLAASLLGHAAFFVMVQLDFSPRRADSLFAAADALKLLAAQVLGALAVGFCALGAGGFGLLVGKALALPAAAGHVYGFVLWRRRGAAPAGAPSVRLFEDALYAAHGLLAAAALLAAVLRS